MSLAPLHALLAEVASVVDAVPYRLVGRWSSRVNKVYATPVQLGSGSGPYVDEVRFRWDATIDCAVPVVVLSLQRDEQQLRWTKESPAPEPRVQLSVIDAVDGPVPPAHVCTATRALLTRRRSGWFNVNDLRD